MSLALPRASSKKEQVPKAKARKVEGAGTVGELVQVNDEPNVEEMKAFSVKMGKWSTEVTAAVSDLTLWYAISVMHRARIPFDHLMRFIDTPSDRTVDGGVVFRLATGDAYRIYNEFNDILQEDIIMLSSPQQADTSHTPIFKRFGICCTLFHAGSYYRRIMMTLSHPPYVYFLMVRSPMDIQCRLRQRSGPRFKHPCLRYRSL